MPIAEAMSCGLYVIVTGLGAALDFCDRENSALIPATLGTYRLTSPDRDAEVVMVTVPS